MYFEKAAVVRILPNSLRIDNAWPFIYRFNGAAKTKMGDVSAADWRSQKTRKIISVEKLFFSELKFPINKSAIVYIISIILYRFVKGCRG